HVFMDRRVAGGAEGIVRAQHLFLFDELADALDGLGRAVAVVQRNELYLSSVDPALVVDHVPEGDDRLAVHAIGRSPAAVGAGVAELDLGVAGAIVVLLLAERQSRRRQARSRR